MPYTRLVKETGAKATGKPVVDAEKAALDRIAQNPKDPDLTGEGKEIEKNKD